MDKKEHIILRLYGETAGEDPAELDDAETAVLAELDEVRQALDRLKPATPGAASLSLIFDAAEAATRERAAYAPDRPVMRRRPARMRRWYVAAATGLLALLIVFLMPASTPPVIPEIAAEEVLSVIQEPYSPLMGWDEREEIQSIYWRIEALHEQNQGLRWDETRVPVGLTTSGTAPRLSSGGLTFTPDR